MKNHVAISVCAVLAFTLFSVDAHAQLTPSTPIAQDDGVFNTLQTEFFNITTVYQARIVELAKRLFFGLAIIHVVWTGIKMGITGADFQKFIAEISKMMLFLGFFLALLLNNDFAIMIVDSFIQGANNVTNSTSASTNNAFDGSGDVSPSGVMNLGNTIALRAIQNISIFKVGAAVLIGLSVILILLSFAVMALRLIMAYVEAYIAVSAGMILIGFGGMSFTSELAKKYLFYLISVGMKLFVLLIVLGLARQLMLDLVSSWTFDNNAQVMLTLALSVILMGLAMSIPNMISGLISGQAGSGGGELVSLGGAALGATAAVGFAKFKAAQAAAGGGASGGAGSAIGGAMSVLNNKGGNGKK